jgi:hypothetical protein
MPLLPLRERKITASVGRKNMKYGRGKKDIGKVGNWKNKERRRKGSQIYGQGRK